ncbi:exosome complex component RRP41-like isoform X2 [Ricinus communis]|uniref:exosome complex component RRP41-like isoform X2 n=1 Tax=Ricinus communis TaxID=3988 RepID=UPI00201AC258|nr:exosome complex component RRP41-like isoform X2 [Ricinus communis]
MASKPGSAPTTYSPTPSRKSRPPIFKHYDVDWVRPDGRSFSECRPAYFRTGAVNAAAGSAYAEFGNTKVIVSVFGPRESKKAMMYSDVGRLNCNVSYTTFSTPVRGQGSDCKEFSSMLHKSLEGDLSVIVSCASLALADAGIMMYDLVAGVSVSCLGANLVIDPILEEESCQDGSLMITCMPSRYEVTQLTVTGEWSAAKMNEAMQLCLDACSKLATVMRSCLKEPASA